MIGLSIRLRGTLCRRRSYLVGCHRKHAVRLLRQGGKPTGQTVPKGQRIYDEAVREALTVVWEASDRICGKRLKAALPSMMESLERHGHSGSSPIYESDNERHGSCD